MKSTVGAIAEKAITFLQWFVFMFGSFLKKGKIQHKTAAIDNPNKTVVDPEPPPFTIFDWSELWSVVMVAKPAVTIISCVTLFTTFSITVFMNNSCDMSMFTSPSKSDPEIYKTLSWTSHILFMDWLTKSWMLREYAELQMAFTTDWYDFCPCDTIVVFSAILSWTASWSWFMFVSNWLESELLTLTSVTFTNCTSETELWLPVMLTSPWNVVSEIPIVKFWTLLWLFMIWL